MSEFIFPPTIGLNRVSAHWWKTRDGDATARALFRRHYSYRPYRDGRNPKLFCGPGEKLVLLTETADALFVWRKFRSMDTQVGVNCAVFRNEGPLLSSMLILEAEKVARSRWGRTRLYTYVDPTRVRSDNPGYCFKCAGYRTVGRTSVNGLLILAKESV